MESYRIIKEKADKIFSIKLIKKRKKR